MPNITKKDSYLNWYPKWKYHKWKIFFIIKSGEIIFINMPLDYSYLVSNKKIKKDLSSGKD